MLEVEVLVGEWTEWAHLHKACLWESLREQDRVGELAAAKQVAFMTNYYSYETHKYIYIK